MKKFDIPDFKGLSGSEVTAIVKRFVKPDSYKGNSKRERSAFTKLFGQYPDPEFWRKWDLGFQLNSLYWLIGADGKEKLDLGYKMFHLDLSTPQPAIPNSIVDDSNLDNLFHPKQDETMVSEPYQPPVKKPSQMTLAGFLS